MAYQTYTTDALVIGLHDRLTADRSYALFTREAGLLYARASGVRKEQSKLRYALQPMTLLRVSLVRGKQGWRIVGAEAARNLYYATDDRDVRRAHVRTVSLLRRLVRGEDPAPELYDCVIEGMGAVAACPPARLVYAEQLLALRVLALLGYVATSDQYQDVLAAPSLADALAALSGQPSDALKRAIDDALTASHL